MAGGLIGNIGGLSGADFSPYQRELERRTQLVIEDMRKRQQEADRKLQEKLGMEQVKLETSKEARLKKEGETATELELRRQAANKEEAAAGREFERERWRTSEEAQKGAEARGEERAKREREAEYETRKKERGDVRAEEEVVKQQANKRNAALNRAAMDAASAATPDEAMIRLRNALDTDPDLSDEDKADILARAPQAVMEYQRHGAEMQRVQQQLRAGQIDIAAAEQKLTMSKGQVVLRTGSEDDPEVQQARTFELQVQDYDVQIQLAVQELEDLTRRDDASYGASVTPAREFVGATPNAGAIAALRQKIQDLSRQKFNAQASLDALIMRLGRRK